MADTLRKMLGVALSEYLEEFGHAEGSESYINVKAWRSCIGLMKVLFKAADVYGVILPFA